MQIEKTGFILYTIHYRKCVDFYRNIIELPILYEKEMLTCFEFGGSYLMVEIDDTTKASIVDTPSRDRVCLRLNVKNVKEACTKLTAHDIPFDYAEFDWGTIAKFRDPDGNLIGFRSAKEHETDSFKK